MVTISLMGSMHVWCQTMLIGSMLFVVLKPKQSILWCWLVCDWQTHSVPSKICRNNTVVAGSSCDSNRKLPIDLVNDVLVRLRVLYNLLVNISVDKYSTFLKIPKWTIGKGHLVGPMADQDQTPSTESPNPKTQFMTPNPNERNFDFLPDDTWWPQIYCYLFIPKLLMCEGCLYFWY